MTDEIERYRVKFTEVYRQKYKEMEDRFNQRKPSDFQELGEVIHYHLMVEDSLVSFIKSENPKIGDFEKGASQFSQKLIIAQNMKNGAAIHRFNKSLQALNEIRNKLGHYPVVLNYPQDRIETLRASIQEFMGDSGKDLSILPNIAVVRFYSTLFCTYMSAVISLEEAYQGFEGEFKEQQEAYVASLEGMLNKLLNDDP